MRACVGEIGKLNVGGEDVSFGDKIGRAEEGEQACLYRQIQTPGGRP